MPRPLTPAMMLRRTIRRLPVSQPLADLWPTHYPSHRVHWLGWLEEYDGPGFYHRRVPKEPRSMAYIYGHIHCGPMLLWLAEAAGVRKYQVMKAHRMMRGMVKGGLHHSNPGIGVAFRQIICWGDVLTALIAKGLMMPVASSITNQRDSITLPKIRKDFWAFLISRHPIEEDHAPSTRNAHRWRPLPKLRLVIVQFVAQHGVGVFVRGQRGGNPAEVENRLRPYAARLKKALGVDEFVVLGHGNPSPKYLFQKFKNFKSSRRTNWGRMADWLHKEANAYQDVLYQVVGNWKFSEG